MTFEQLQSFRAVADLGSFSRAGNERVLAQSTISMQMKALERELGVRLFERLGRRSRLTAAGERFLPYAERILTLVEDSRLAMEEIRRVAGGRLTVGASNTVGNYLAPDFLGRFNAAYPKVRLVLEIAPTSPTAERVLDGSLDIGLVEAPVSAPELTVQPFLGDEQVLIVPRGHPWAERGEIDPKEMPDERFIAREPGSFTRKIIEERFRALGVELRPVLELGTPEAIIGAVSAGLGVSILSRHAASLALAAGMVVEVRLSGLRLERDLYVLLHKDKHISPALSAFLELLGVAAVDPHQPP